MREVDCFACGREDWSGSFGRRAGDVEDWEASRADVEGEGGCERERRVRGW